ncbi:MAG TPA: poly-gamma-glutamate biosynthesis protein PgsC/CapC, partial [Myxococcota bacterium]|nr:poly-gamma-glutamate biosynthesis protein PgsC/CapC [Myxococcota bacterium]
MYLPLFPETGETAILTTVLVGVLWLFALQETIGWPFSGLVVPGLLAAVYLVDPVAAGVTVAEAVITAVLAWLLSDLSARWGLWSRFFGRDQFFLVVVLSTAVRLVVEWGWLEAMVAPDNPGLLGSLNSVGLVLVPLVAYTLYRAGVVRGVPQVAVPTALTWAVLNWVVMPYTNLSLSLFQLDHEDLRQQLAENPRVWIILLVGSWIASRARLRYGWDYGGIVVPGLLAIAWLTPVQLVGTVLEVLVLTAAMHLLLSFPGLRSINFTGSRPLVLCFVLEYILQIILSHLLPIYLPEIRVSHILGIGYIMPSLLAVRCWRAGDTVRVMLPALGVSFGGAAAATAMSIGLAVLNPGITPRFSTPLVVADPLIALANAPMRTDAPLHLDLRSRRHEEAARALLRGEEPLVPADLNLSKVGNESILAESSNWSSTGRGALAIRPGTQLAVVVPPTSRQPLALLAGLALREKLGASVLLIKPDNLVRWPAPALIRAVRAEGIGTISLSLSEGETALTGGANLAGGLQSLRPYLTQDAPGEASLELSRNEAISLAALVFGRDPSPWPGLMAVV